MAKPIMSRTTGAVAAILLTALVATGCHHRPHHVPGWNQPPPPPAQPPAPPPQHAHPPVVDTRPVVIAAPADDRPAAAPVRTFTAGCSGGYSVVDASGRVVRTGRAYNTGEGLVSLDTQGRQGAPVAQPGANQSLLFLPDCACGAGPVQDGPPGAPHGHHPGCPPHRH